jgi:hypothetical protein
MEKILETKKKANSSDQNTLIILSSSWGRSNSPERGRGRRGKRKKSSLWKWSG